MIDINHKNILLDVGDTLVKITEPFEIYTNRAIEQLFYFLTESNNLSITAFSASSMEIRNEIRAEAHKTLEEFSFSFFLRRIEERLLVSFQDDFEKVEAAYVSEELKITSLINGTIPFLESAKSANKKLYIATNNFSAIHVRLLLEQFDLLRFVDGIFISGEMGVRKPSAGFIDSICKSADLDKTETIIIGDKPTMDLQAALNSGIDSIWYNPSSKENPDSVLFTYQIQHHHQLNFV